MSYDVFNPQLSFHGKAVQSEIILDLANTELVNLWAAEQLLHDGVPGRMTLAESRLCQANRA